MGSYTVILNFSDGVYDYDLPHIFSLSDPNPGMKATVIEGNRASGSLIIPGGQKSIEIIVRGNIFDSDGYADLETAIEEMKTKITTDVATLTLKYWTGAIWQNNWQYTVRRISEITFPESLRTDVQEYSIKFLVISY